MHFAFEHSRAPTTAIGELAAGYQHSCVFKLNKRPVHLLDAAEGSGRRNALSSDVHVSNISDVSSGGAGFSPVTLL